MSWKLDRQNHVLFMYVSLSMDFIADRAELGACYCSVSNCITSVCHGQSPQQHCMSLTKSKSASLPRFVLTIFLTKRTQGANKLHDTKHIYVCKALFYKRVRHKTISTHGKISQEKKTILQHALRNLFIHPCVLNLSLGKK